MKAAARRVLERLDCPVDVLAVGPGQRAHQRPLHRPRDDRHRLEVPRGGDRKAELDHVHPEVAKGDRHRHFLLKVHARAGRLFSVAQRGVEDDYSVFGAIMLHHAATSSDESSSPGLPSASSRSEPRTIATAPVRRSSKMPYGRSTSISRWTFSCAPVSSIVIEAECRSTTGPGKGRIAAAPPRAARGSLSP